MTRHVPDELVEKITSYLPIKIAARTTLFSQNLTSSWRQNRNICFIHNEDFDRINNIMNQLQGSKIDRMALKINASGHEDQINNWIQIAVAKGVEELDLDFSIGEQSILISSDLMDTESANVRVLKLASCGVRFSQQLNGLQILKTIHFRKVDVTLSLMREIMRNCLALEDLEIEDCGIEFGRLNIMAGLLKHFKRLKLVNFGENCTIIIYSLTLEELSYHGEICGFLFGAPLSKLSSVSLTLLPCQKLKFVPRALHVLGSIRYCTKLQLSGKFFQGLFPEFSGLQYTHFHYLFWSLRDLTLYIDGKNITRRGTTFINPCDIAYFLQGCPFLEKLFINLGDYPFGEGKFWKLEAKKRFEMCRPQFRSLKCLFINGFKYRNLEFQLLRMIVEQAPYLRNVTLVKSTAGDSVSDRELCLEWMKAQRCSFDVQPPM